MNPSEPPRPPVMLGCFFLAAAVLAVVGLLAFALVFLESGAETGKLRLDVADAYAPGEVLFVGERNLFLVRLASGDFLALRDLDQPNRASGGRCRVALTSIDDAALPLGPAPLRSRFSPDAQGAVAVFLESCRGSVYDAAGILLTGSGPNLDRYAVSVGLDGRVVIDLRQRNCSARTEREVLSPVAC